MKTDKLIDQLELYSNGVVAFMVAQSIGFSITFGTDVGLSCDITKYKALAVGLVAHFLLCTVLGGLALRYLGRKICQLSAENQGVVRMVFRAKIAILVLFVALPMGLLLTFGVMGDAKVGRCAHAAPPSASASKCVSRGNHGISPLHPCALNGSPAGCNPADLHRWVRP